MASPATSGSTSATDRPRFRQDLVAELVEDEGNRFIDVADPDSGNVYRFFEVEFSIACAMDGQRDAAGIRDWAKEELGLMPSLNEVRNVVATLRDLGYLDQTGAETAAPTPAAVIEAARPEPAKAATPAAAAPNKAAAKGATLSGPAVSRPTAPADKDLAQGIVVGTKGAAQPVEDVELGSAGTSSTAPTSPLPKSADIALGAPGASATAKPPKIPVEDVALGTAGAKAGSDVSLDLADHIAVGKDDVKEAVRASKVMTAVEVPKELQDALEDKKPAATPAKVEPAKVEPAKPATPATAKPEPSQPTAKGDGKGKGKDKKGGQPQAQAQAAKAEAKQEAKAEKKAEPAKAEPAKQEAKKAEPAKQEAKKSEPAKQEAKKSEPAKADAGKKGTPGKQESKKAPLPPPPEPEPQTSRALVYLLLLVLVAGGGFLVWKYVLRKPATTPVTTTPPSKPIGEKPVTPPAPVLPKAAMAMTVPSPLQLVAGVPGELESIIPDGTEVKSGDIVALLKGHKKFEPQMEKLEKELKKLQDQAVAVTKLRDEARAGSAANATEFEQKYTDVMAKVNEKQAEIDKLRAERAKLEIVASGTGKLMTAVKAGEPIIETTPLGTIAQVAVPTVTFKLPPTSEVRYEVGSSQTISVGDKLVTCEVAALTGQDLTLVCPANELTKEGTEVIFRAPPPPR